LSVLTRFRHLLGQAWLRLRMNSSADYWERRYRLGMTSGSGSEGELAAFKARVINEFVRAQGIQTVIELGCGDGQQLALAEYPQYLGVDVSQAAVELCRRRFAGDRTKAFLWEVGSGTPLATRVAQADLTLSLDVIYHLLEDEVYRRYLADLFGTSRRHVIVYSSNRPDTGTAPHVRHREFTRDVTADFPEFSLVRTVKNPYPSRSFADFYVFCRASGGLPDDTRRR
jgi:SAM-dependent methyltransferase